MPAARCLTRTARHEKRPMSLFANEEWCFLREKRGGNATMRPQGFETDFWKDANLRKSWDEIVPGEPRKTLPYVLTPEATELYRKSARQDLPRSFPVAYPPTTHQR